MSSTTTAGAGAGAAPIRVVIAEDQDLVRAALTALLNLQAGVEVIGGVGRGDEVLAAVRDLRPDVLLLDIEMPGMNGLDAAAAVRAEAPGTRVLIVTTFGRPGYVKRAIAAGASGFVVKDTPPEQLSDAIRRVHAGLRVIDPTLAADSLMAPDNPLSEREVEVCRAAADGSGPAAIAAALHLSDGTVRNHLSSAIRKTGASNRYEAVRIATDNGWL
ncbi:response regulator transcription factor [Helcobacillus massiliensis]|uniref:response regulator transcription factor n=1 Tax=Helcobacillus massiliensis TaxID=521392 RepID=UPI002552E391|nr:response regulator transcription factor [Helcobacillus massiliensis]MDK7741819.1 response regulator transcription factor [Helcobacillus massiliensis]WOO92990.1 response regulator transcription factor [Helcobacillus massiliensis]